MQIQKRVIRLLDEAFDTETGLVPKKQNMYLPDL